eukprot:75025-Hanusia_phi.AAC.1
MQDRTGHDNITATGRNATLDFHRDTSDEFLHRILQPNSFVSNYCFAHDLSLKAEACSFLTFRQTDSSRQNQ